MVFLFLMLASGIADAAQRPFRVVIDPGHGGADMGTIFDDGKSRISEKEATLLIARETARTLRTKGYDVFLTRTTDREVPLPTRTAMANRLNADVFLSIHMNSSATPGAADAEGIETYILNNTTDASSKRLAHLENKYSAADYDPAQSDVALILKDLRLDANLSESKLLACSLQGSLVGATARKKSRGVKQALFYVLLGADMPSVLVEAGFLANARDRALVLSSKGRRKLGRAISQAIQQYERDRGTPAAHSELSRCKVH